MELAVREHLADDLAGNVSLDELKDWLVGATWNIDETADQAAITLAYDIKLALAEESGGFITEAELRDELRSLVHLNAAAR